MEVEEVEEAVVVAVAARHLQLVQLLHHPEQLAAQGELE